MDHEQKRHEKHEQERKHARAEERQHEQNFSKLGPTIRPLWFLVTGIALVTIAMLIWWLAYA